MADERRVGKFIIENRRTDEFYAHFIAIKRDDPDDSYPVVLVTVDDYTGDYEEATARAMSLAERIVGLLNEPTQDRNVTTKEG